ncbi:MAG: Fis family transcriptional regulator [Chromatiales bacterium]|nr:MAG: Fis family transcriptional regulator [Chromatiales bacterium]
MRGRRIGVRARPAPARPALRSAGSRRRRRHAGQATCA